MGGSGGGGSSAGEIGYPAYMETIHEDWLGTFAGAPAQTVSQLMQTAQTGANPFAAFSTASPANVMGSGVQVLTPFRAVEDLDALNLTTLFTGFFATLDDNAQILATVAAEAAILDARLVADVLPRFQRGMRDIGAVLTTGFTIGQANMEASHDLSVAKLDAELRLQSRRLGWQMSMQWVQLNIDWNKIVATLADEVAVRYLEARFKGDQLDVEMDAKNVLFDLEVYQYGSNVLAAISGATATSKPESSMVGTTLGSIASGAASGAAAGALFGNPAAGAVVGGLLGLAAAIF